MKGYSHLERPSIVLRHIEVSQLCVGMFIHELCGSWVDHPFWKRSFLLESPQDLEAIRVSPIHSLWIDLDKGLNIPAEPAPALHIVEPAEPPRKPLRRPLAPPRLAMNDELLRAADICSRSKTAVAQMFGELRMGQVLGLERVGDMVLEISDSLMRHPDALISLARLKTADEHCYLHSVAVCALMIGLARRLELPPNLVQEAGIAGLLHDVGKIGLPAQILAKTSPLDEQESRIWCGHPEAGGKMLLESRHISLRVLDVCLHHHERADGSGYPHKLCGTQISLFARMAAVCDVYDSMTSRCSGKPLWGPAEAIRQMVLLSAKFDQKVLHAFVRCVGIYPVGTLVRLRSGRLAVVVEQHPETLLLPKVKVFYSIARRIPIDQQVVDLALVAQEESILGPESEKTWGFKNLEQFWAAGAASEGMQAH